MERDKRAGIPCMACSPNCCKQLGVWDLGILFRAAGTAEQLCKAHIVHKTYDMQHR